MHSSLGSLINSIEASYKLFYEGNITASDHYFYDAVGQDCLDRWCFLAISQRYPTALAQFHGYTNTTTSLAKVELLSASVQETLSIFSDNGDNAKRIEISCLRVHNGKSALHLMYNEDMDHMNPSYSSANLLLSKGRVQEFSSSSYTLTGGYGYGFNYKESACAPEFNYDGTSCQYYSRRIYANSAAFSLPTTIEYSKLPEGYTFRYWNQAGANGNQQYFISQAGHFQIQERAIISISLHDNALNSFVSLGFVVLPKIKAIRWRRHSFVFDKLNGRVIYYEAEYDWNQFALGLGQAFPIDADMMSSIDVSSVDFNYFHSFEMWGELKDLSWLEDNYYNSMINPTSHVHLLSYWYPDYYKTGAYGLFEFFSSQVAAETLLYSDVNNMNEFCRHGNRRKATSYCFHEPERSLILAKNAGPITFSGSDLLLGNIFTLLFSCRVDGVSTLSSATLEPFLELGNQFKVGLQLTSLKVYISLDTGSGGQILSFESQSALQTSEWISLAIFFQPSQVKIQQSLTELISEALSSFSLSDFGAAGDLALRGFSNADTLMIKDIAITPRLLRTSEVMLFQNRDKASSSEIILRLYLPLFESDGLKIYDHGRKTNSTISHANVYWSQDAQNSLRTCTSGQYYIEKLGCVDKTQAFKLTTETTSFATSTVNLNGIDGQIAIGVWLRSDYSGTSLNLTQVIVALSNQDFSLSFSDSTQKALSFQLLSSSGSSHSNSASVEINNQKWNYLTAGVRLTTTTHKSYLGINDTTIVISEILEPLKIAQIKDTQLSLIIGGLNEGQIIQISFALRELRLFKHFLHPFILFSQFSQTQRQESAYYWKLFPIYAEQYMLEFQKDEQFLVPRIGSVDTYALSICEGDNYRDYRYPDFCRKIHNRFMKFTGSFEAEITVSQFKTMDAPLDFTAFFWFQADATDGTEWLELNIASIVSIQVNAAGQVQMLHQSGAKIHQAQTLRLLQTKPQPNQWLMIGLSCKEGVQYNSLVESIDLVFSESETHEITAPLTGVTFLNSFKLVSSLVSSVCYLHNLLVLNYAHQVSAMRQLSREEIKLFYLNTALAYVRFGTKYNSNSIQNLVDPDSNLIFITLPTIEEVQSTNDATGDLILYCPLVGLQAGQSDCSLPQQIVECNQPYGHCSHQGTLLFCDSGTHLNSNPPLCVGSCASSQRGSFYACVDPICSSTYQTSESLCEQQQFNKPSLSLSSDNTQLTLQFSQLTQITASLQDSNFSMQVEGTFSEYNLQWNLVTSIPTGGIFLFNMLIRNTLSGGGREKLVMEFKDVALFKTVNDIPLSTTILEIDLNAQINPDFLSDIENAQVIDSVASTIVYTVMSQQLALALATGWSLSFLWGILNFLQVFEFLMLIDAKFPKNFLEFQQIAQVANLQFKILETLPNFISILLNEDELEDGPLNGIFNDQEFQFTAFTNVHRSGTNFAFIFLSLWPMMLILKAIIQKCNKKSEKQRCKCLISRINGVYSFNGLYRFFLEIYFQLTICAFIASTNLGFSNRSQAIVSVHAIVALTLVAFFPIYSYVYLCLNCHRFKNKRFKENRGALVQDLKQLKKNSKRIKLLSVYYFYPLFLFKRIVFSAVLVFCRDYPVPQLFVLFSISAVSLILTSIFRPFQDKIRNVVEILEDSIFVLVFLIVIVITMHPVSEAVSFRCGWLLVAIPLTSIAFSLSIIIVSTIAGIARGCRKCRKKKKPTPQSKILTSPISPSSTLHDHSPLGEDSNDQSAEARQDFNSHMYKTNENLASEIEFRDHSWSKKVEIKERGGALDSSNQEITVEQF